MPPQEFPESKSGLLGDDSVSAEPQSVQPRGQPSIASTKRGFSTRPPLEVSAPSFGIVGSRRELASDARTASGTPAPLPFFFSALSRACRTRHVSGFSPSFIAFASGVGHIAAWPGSVRKGREWSPCGYVYPRPAASSALGLLPSCAFGVGHRTASAGRWSDPDPSREFGPPFSPSDPRGVGNAFALKSSLTCPGVLLPCVEYACGVGQSAASCAVGVAQDEDSFASVRGSDRGRAEHAPLRIEPEAGQVPENFSAGGSIVGR